MSKKHFPVEAGTGGLSVKVHGDVDKAIKRFKKLVMDDGILKEVKSRRYYEKPGDKRRREKAEARRRYMRAESESETY